MEVKYRAFTSKRTFGVEVEYTHKVKGEAIHRAVASADRGHPVDLYDRYVKDEKGRGWQVKPDGSICDRYHDYGWEVSSFKGSGWQDIATVERVLTAVKKLGVVASPQCGVHIHAGAKDFTREQMAGLIAQWVRVEPAISQMVPVRRTRSDYCRPLRSRLELGRGKKPVTCEDLMHLVEEKVYEDDDTRRASLNVCNWVEKDRQTLELRLPEGTVEPAEIGHWVRFFLGFVDTNRRCGYDGNLAPVGVAKLMEAVGLSGGQGRCLILSRGLHKTKVWALKRILKNGRTKQSREKARELLDYIEVSGDQAPAL